MNKSELHQFCQNEMDSYVYDLPESTVGRSLPKDKVLVQLSQLKSAIVEPYLKRMELRDTFEQIGIKAPEYAKLWVVADDKNGYKVFYDPVACEFGLASYTEGDIPQTIGVRGDFVDTFMAR